MSLPSRYVANVQRYLPLHAREDVGRELQSLLEDRFEAESERLGRPLEETEIAAILHEFGHPFRVAATYMPAPALGSAGAFALYRRALGRIVPVWMSVLILVTLFEIYSDHGVDALVAVPEFWHGTFDVLLVLFVLISGFFYFAGTALDHSGKLWRWNPARLPEVKGTWLLSSLPHTIGGAVLAVSFLGLIVAAPHTFVSSDGTVVASGSGVRQLLPVLHGLALFALVQTIVNMFQRHMTRMKLYAWCVTALAIAGLVSWLIVSQRVLQLSEPGLGKWGTFFLSVWPEIWLKLLLAVGVVLLIRSALRTWGRSRIPGLPLI